MVEVGTTAGLLIENIIVLTLSLAGINPNQYNNSVYSDEIPHSVAFHLSLHCLL